MTIPDADHLLAFTAAAALVTVVPGLDTALVLRTAISRGARQALLTGLGIVSGCLGWGLIVAVGLGALLTASELAYSVLRVLGALYLLYLGARLIWLPRRTFEVGVAQEQSGGAASWVARGFLTNILNPKVGVFYVSFLPQFIPPYASVTVWTMLLTVIHAALGFAWFCALVGATRPIAAGLRKAGTVTWLDRVTGGVFVLFGCKLAFGEHR